MELIQWLFAWEDAGQQKSRGIVITIQEQRRAGDQPSPKPAGLTPELVFANINTPGHASAGLLMDHLAKLGAPELPPNPKPRDSNQPFLPPLCLLRRDFKKKKRLRRSSHVVTCLVTKLTLHGANRETHRKKPTTCAYNGLLHARGSLVLSVASLHAGHTRRRSLMILVQI